MKQRLLLFCYFIGLLSNVNVQAQSGYIYIHKKALDESSSVNFDFTFSGGSTSIGTITLNDKPDIIDAYDVGASHGTGGDGQLWAITGPDATGRAHTGNGPIYMRPAGSSVWQSIANQGESIDGAGANQMVYTTSGGEAFLYTVGSGEALIYQATNHQQTGLRDIAWGGGMTVAVNANGEVIKYTGNYSDRSDSWAVVYTSSISIYRVDVVHSTRQIVMQASDGTVYTMNDDGSNLVTLPFPDNSNAPTYPEVAVDDNGKIYANFNYAPDSGDNYMFAYTGASWVREEQTRKTAGITGGVAGQMWASLHLDRDSRNSIYSRATDGSSTWFDDERVRTTVADNSTMIPVSPGTYTITENLPAGWDINTIMIYDPTANSTAEPTKNTALLNVAAGEVIHIVYANELVSTVAIDNNCSTQYIETFGSGSAQFGGVLTGHTAYHYVESVHPEDGYYTLEKEATGWGGYPDPITADHTPDAIDGANPGYFLLINASYGKDEFYRKRITGLVSGQQYTLSFWIANISSTAVIAPDVTFGAVDITTGTFINSVSTGPFTNTYWKQYQVSFTGNANGIADLVLRNNAVGGFGNDLVIDDITLNISAPVISGITGTTAVCSIPSSNTYAYSNATSGGTWSVTPASLASIDANTGVLTTVANGNGAATITYSVMNSGSCVSMTTLDIVVSNTNCGSPMPVGLVNFTAQAQSNRSVLVRWRTSWEHNNKGYRIERSKDLKTFETLGEVTDVAGSSNSINSYQFVDDNPYRGTSYYRLRQVDVDGTTHVFRAESVVIGGVYGVYPNPVAGPSFTLQLDEPITALVRLYDVSGREIPVEKKVHGEINVQVSTGSKLSAGLYLLTVDERGSIRKYRLIVQ